MRHLVAPTSVQLLGPHAAANLLGMSEPLVDAALAYYADYTDEIDELIAERARLAAEAEASWHRQRELLER